MRMLSSNLALRGTPLTLQEEYGAQTLNNLGAASFLDSLKQNLSPDDRLIVDDILERLYLISNSEEPAEVIQYQPSENPPGMLTSL